MKMSNDVNMEQVEGRTHRMSEPRTNELLMEYAEISLEIRAQEKEIERLQNSLAVDRKRRNELEKIFDARESLR